MGCKQSKEGKEEKNEANNEQKEGTEEQAVEGGEQKTEGGEEKQGEEGKGEEGENKEKDGDEKPAETKDEKKDEKSEEKTATDEKEDKGKSDSSEPKLMVVFGATGAQGGSVTRALLTDNNYKVRGITRNVDSEKAKDLAAKGCEMVAANLDDVDSLKKAFEGAYGAYVVTNYWEHLDAAKDTQQGKNAVDAAKACGLKHFVYSGLEDVKAILGKEGCHHFDSKAAVEAYLKEVGLPFTSTRMSFYMENLLTFLKPQKNESGEFVLGIPMEGAAMDFLAVSDCGECIHQVLNKPDEFLGKHIGLSGDKITIDKAAEIVSEVTGQKFIAAPITTEVFGTLPFPGAAENAIMFEFYIKGNPDRDLELTRKLNPATPTFQQWCEKNKDNLLKALE